MVVFVVITAVLIVTIASWRSVGSRGCRSAARPSVFDEDEAVECVADRLPDEVTAQLSHDDVRQIVEWHLDYLEHDRGRRRQAADRRRADGVVVGEDDGLAYVLGQAGEVGLEADDTQIALVLDAERAYLGAIGAIGPQVRRGVGPPL